MDKEYDKEQIYCPECKHCWVLISNKEITDYQHNVWVNYVEYQHRIIAHKKEGGK